MFDSLGTVASVFSLVLGVMIYWFDVRKKFDELLRNQEGILSKAQADDLAHLYLNTVQARLSLALGHYARNDFPGHLERGEIDRIMAELERAYESVVQQSIKPMVTTFRLRGRHQFDDLVSRVSRKSVDDAFRSVRTLMTEAVERKRPLTEVLPRIEAVMTAVNKAGTTLILREIDRLYPRAAAE